MTTESRSCFREHPLTRKHECTTTLNLKAKLVRPAAKTTGGRCIFLINAAILAMRGSSRPQFSSSSAVAPDQCLSVRGPDFANCFQKSPRLQITKIKRSKYDLYSIPLQTNGTTRRGFSNAQDPPRSQTSSNTKDRVQFQHARINAIGESRNNLACAFKRMN